MDSKSDSFASLVSGSELLGMPLEVLLEVLPQHKTLSAHLAAVVAHTSMHQVVSIQIALEVKLATANGALEDLALCRVNPVPAPSSGRQCQRRLQRHDRTVVLSSGQEVV